MKIDYINFFSLLSEEENKITQDEIWKEIVIFLNSSVPEWDKSINDPILLYERIHFSKELLQIILINNNRFRSIEVTTLRKLDLSELDFTGCDVSGLDLSYTNVDINPQTIKDKSLFETNCEGLNFKNKDFTGVSLAFANLENTSADINPQTIKDKCLYQTNCKGLNFVDRDLTGVDIRGACLAGTGANLSKEIERKVNQLILQKSHSYMKKNKFKS